MFGYGEDCASALNGSSGRILFAGCAPLCALQACYETVQVKSVMSEIDILVSPTSLFTLGHKKKLKKNTFVGNTGHFDDEFDFAGTEGLEGTEVDHITTLVWYCTGVFRISRFFRICRILRIFLSAGVIRQVENPR